jgi:hypothetical protein
MIQESMGLFFHHTLSVNGETIGEGLSHAHNVSSLAPLIASVRSFAYL